MPNKPGVIRFLELLLLGGLVWLLSGQGASNHSTPPAPPPYLGVVAHSTPPPQLSIEPYVRPAVAAQIAALRPTILAAAARHNRPRHSGLSNQEFATVLALILYNERNGWLEDRIEPLRLLTPWYERLQVEVNRSSLGSNLSIWPANVRPSVAAEILRGQVPVPPPTGVITVPLLVAGSKIDPARVASEAALYAAISAEVHQDDLAVAYLAANLERGVIRARYEGVPISWRTLAAWHNQGIVQPAQIRAHSYGADYVRRASAYLPRARCLVAPRCAPEANPGGR